MNRGGNILFSGVGGQGILLASELTAQAVLAAGFDAKKSEVHGMAQRGGSVEAHLRYGKKVYSPLIEPGKADILVAFEMMEAARYLAVSAMAAEDRNSPDSSRGTNSCLTCMIAFLKLGM